MLQPVALAHKSLADYTHIVGRPLVEEIRELAEPLKGKRVVQLSATAFGGGVSEILYTLIPLMRDVGLEVEWQVIYGREEFFNSTKLMHNALQGNPQDLTEEQWATWFQYNEMNARELSRGWDICLVHDPQPAAMLSLAPGEGEGVGVALPHRRLDAEPGDDGAPAPVHPAATGASLFHVADYVPPGMDGGVNIVPPAIDPLAPKNMALSIEDATFVCKQFGIDTSRPMMCQVSRFDPWKDPLGVIDAYRIGQGGAARRAARAGRLDGLRRPRGLGLLQLDARPRRRRSGHPHPQQLQQRRGDRGQRVPVARRRRDPEVDARGLRPDRVSEALWKGRPFIGGDVGGIPLQVEDGESGYLVSTVEDCAKRSLEIFNDPALGKALGRRGKEHVREHFLTPRYLRDYLKIFQEVL